MVWSRRRMIVAGLVGALIAVVIPAAVGVLVYLGLVSLLRMEEVRQLRAQHRPTQPGPPKR